MFVSKITKTYFEELIGLLRQFDMSLRSNKEIEQWFYQNDRDKEIFSAIKNTIMMMMEAIDRDFIDSTIFYFQFNTLDYAIAHVHRSVLHFFGPDIFPKSAASDRRALGMLFFSFKDQIKKIGYKLVICSNLIQGKLVNPNLIVGDGFFFKRET